MLIHPPMLYLGLVGFTLPFAFAIASLITGRLDEDWQGETRRWTLFAWAFLTMGILLGAWWSYQVLGWGGFWGWDPVENAALLPWLVGTAYLHSVMVQQRRGLLRIWNLSLVVAAFSLTILGTFLTRSGVTQSVHSFSNSTIGPLLLAFFGVVLLTGVGLIAWRGDRLHSPGGIDSPLSREGAFLANNVLFVGFAFIVLLGTVFPLFYEALDNGTQLGVGAPYFNRFFIPVGLALLFLMAVAPALPWRKTTVEVMRGRLAVPAAIGVAVVVTCVLAGIRGFDPLLAFGLGAFAAASAGRSLALSSAVPTGAPGQRALLRPGPHSPGGAGFVGRANGGMVVHIGVVVIAVGLAAATSFLHRGELHLSKGQSAMFAGHTRRPSSAPARSTRRPVRRSKPSCGSITALHAGHQPVRHRDPDRRHAGHRLELAGRPVPDHRLHPGHGGRLDLRGGRAATGHVAVDRRRSDRRRLGAVGHPRPPASPDRPGVRPVVDVSSASRARRRRIDRRPRSPDARSGAGRGRSIHGERRDRP